MNNNQDFQQNQSGFNNQMNYNNPVSPNNQMNYNNDNKNNAALIIGVIVISLLVVGGVFFIVKNNFFKNANVEKNSNNAPEIVEPNVPVENTQPKPENNNELNTQDENNTQNNGAQEINADLGLLEFKYKNIVVKLPATKESFNGTGWVWDSKYADKMLDSHYTASGGRIGNYPGGVVVGVTNTTKTLKKIQDCTIDSLFFSKSDENVIFIGGLTMKSTEEEVQKTMSKLGYKNPKIKTIDDSSFYTYYKDDNKDDFRNNIEFQFFKKEMFAVDIKSEVKIEY